MAGTIRDAAANAGPTPGDPNPTLQERLEQIDGRLRDNKVTIPEEQVHPEPERQVVKPVHFGGEVTEDTKESGWTRAQRLLAEKLRRIKGERS